MNRLKDATSPYLLQHADNPVDWYPWGDEAFQTAQREDKPILLSVGYSACHWCHVMAHESFEDPETAALMNRDFVCIKVDREERPDVDDIYMQATLLFTRGHGGWPMTVFLTPDGQPFHAGTYFPKEDRYGMPSFSRVMAQVIDAYRNRRAQVEQVAHQVTDGLRKVELGIGSAQEELTPQLLDAAYKSLAGQFDPDYGGLTRGKPKFPGAMSFEFMLQSYARTGDPRALEIVTFSLRKMAQGGIYDQVGGGFHRYSVDEFWLVPHFEKMLYDNAQLSRLYLHTWQATGDLFFGQIAVEIYDYVLREMAAPGGGFYSSTDADSEGEEGKFFVWTPAELKAVLDEDEVRAAIAWWGISAEGNFEGKNILYVPLDEAVVAESLEIDIGTLRERIASARQKLYTARAERTPPHRDEKILTAWNGMMLASLAEAARVLGREDYLEAAIRCAAFLLESMREDGRLLRSHKDGQSHLNAYLEDYANLIDGLIALYQATFEPRYLSEALALAELVLAHFAARDGGFFDTSDDHETLILRPRNQQDSAVPSGSSLIAKVLLLLAAYTGEARYEAAARSVLLPLATLIREYPGAFGEAASTATLLVRGIDEIAIVGDAANPTTGALLEVVNTGYRPTVIRAFAPQESGAEAVPPLLAWRSLVEGQPAAYVCRHFACLRPVTTPEALRAALEDTPNI